MTHTLGPDYDAADWKRVQERRAKEARLIAAAPDMLAALREVIRFIDSVGSEHINRVPFAAARAAIAKAEGEGQ